MDTKLKKSRILRGCLGVAAVAVAVAVSLGLFMRISNEAETQWSQNNDTDDQYRQMVYSEILEPIYHGSYILNLENANRYEELNNQMLMEEWNGQFSSIRDRVDYYVTNEDGSKTSSNNSNNLGGLLQLEKTAWQQIGQICSRYSVCFRMNYDSEGILTVERIYEEPIEGEPEETGVSDWIIKNLQAIDRQNQNLTQDVYLEDDMDWRSEKVERPRELTIVWGIPSEYLHTFSAEAEALGYWERVDYYQQYGAFPLYYGTLAVLLLAALLFTSKYLWKEKISYHRIGFCYGAELAVAAVLILLGSSETFAGWILRYSNTFGGWAGRQLRGPFDILRGGNPSMIMNLLVFAAILIWYYGIWYLSLLQLRPVFSLGIRQYVREYSLIYLIGRKCRGWYRKKWSALQEEIRHIDFEKKGMRTILHVVILNFVVLSVISCFWVLGIIGLLFYSVTVFFLIKQQYDLARADYGKLLDAASRMAEGDLNAIEKSQKWGMFEPVKEELEKIRVGFGRAVEEEVKSQRMKTELITNVSHDLKTPLTAITTYVELLKNPEITPEERSSYIETLERKSLRLKVLIEDLFEISKATSNNITLDLMRVDVVNLLKQVSVEHADKFEERGLELRWKLPEKAVCTLDSQKTYRIFENLFVNIEKYAMANSRVYVEVHQEPVEDKIPSEAQISEGGPHGGSRRTRILL